MIDKEFIAKQKKVIEESIEKFEEEIGRNSRYSDYGSSEDDNTQEFEVMEEKQALKQSEQKELADLKLALKRIDDGVYGVCLKCASTIETGRLKAYPSAAYCAAHANLKE